VIGGTVKGGATAIAVAASAIVLLGMVLAAQADRKAEMQKWPVHDTSRPMPPVVDPGPAGPPAPVPSDAVVLFDGTDLSEWETTKGAEPTWRIQDGYMEVVKGAGSIRTKRAFGDCQLHLEWASPSPPVGEGQDRGNSGVILMEVYEVQILDSHGNKTYADGTAGSLYGQYPPLVNASRKPGEWQTYDIVFHAPRFGKDGEVRSPARFTVFHNRILIQDDEELSGPTAHKARPPYKPHAERLPFVLQDHSHPVRFRNVWVRELDR
jgi:hypothetical protein